ncbi:MAG: hypothetical protein WA421_18540 [Nitrososphaeraceae archaeon]
MHEQHTHALPTVFQVVIHKFTFSDAFRATVGDFFQKNGSAIILAALTGLIVAIIGLVVKRIPGLSKNESDKSSDKAKD